MSGGLAAPVDLVPERPGLWLTRARRERRRIDHRLRAGVPLVGVLPERRNGVEQLRGATEHLELRVEVGERSANTLDREVHDRARRVGSRLIVVHELRFIVERRTD